VCNKNKLLICLFSGANGTVDGQGAVWWDWFHNHTLNYTRPPLVELMYSTRVVISNLTFINSPFWNIHPVYCRFLSRISSCHLLPKHRFNRDDNNYPLYRIFPPNEQPGFGPASHNPSTYQFTKHRRHRSRCAFLGLLWLTEFFI
jgi:hypothetical protein